MIKLKNLLALNEMTYNSGPEGRHIERMMQPLTLFVKEYTLPNQLPPENSSHTTLDEIKYLTDLELDEEYVKKYDKVKKVFKELLEELGLPYVEEELKSLLNESGKFIIDLIYKYNRPRPQQIAEFYGMDLGGIELDSMKTPSYPSGHAVQGYLAGMFYSKKYPKHAKKFNILGEHVAHSRIVAKAHYPSDKQFGRVLAERLFFMLNK